MIVVNCGELWGIMKFIGKYSYMVDHKGRIFVPAKFRKILSPDDEETFIITRGFDKSLVVYPRTGWKEFEEKLKELPYFKQNIRQVVRYFTANAEESVLDSQGRIKVPPHLLDFAEIKKDVIVIGALDKIEIWNPELYRKMEEETEQSIEDKFEELNL